MNFAHEAVDAYEALRRKQSKHATGEQRPFDRLAVVPWARLLPCIEGVRIGVPEIKPGKCRYTCGKTWLTEH